MAVQGVNSYMQKFFITCQIFLQKVRYIMSLGDKTHVLLSAVGSDDITPEKMKSMLVELRADAELVHTGAVLPMLQLALQAALTSDNDAASERRLGVLQVIAGALAEDYCRAYVRTIFAERGCSASLINKVLDAAMKKGM